jgi:hypothetical protein
MVYEMHFKCYLQDRHASYCSSRQTQCFLHSVRKRGPKVGLQAFDSCILMRIQFPAVAEWLI